MKKLVGVLGLFSLLTMGGCGQEATLGGQSVEKVELLEFEQMGNHGKKVIETYTGSSKATPFSSAIEKSEEIQGLLNVGEANYNFKVTYGGGKELEYHLWLDKSNNTGMIANIEDTEKGFRLSQEDVERLIKTVE